MTKLFDSFRALLDSLGPALQAHADRVSAWAHGEYMRGYAAGYEDALNDRPRSDPYWLDNMPEREDGSGSE